MTTPTIMSDVAAAGGTKGARVDRSGAVRSQKGTAAVPSGAATGTIIGMIPFNKGMSLQHLAVLSAALGTSVTIDVGYVYTDNVTFTDAPAALVSASTVAAAGGSVVWPIAAGLLVGTGFVAQGDGYLTIRTGGATTTTAGSVVVNALLSYDA